MNDYIDNRDVNEMHAYYESALEALRNCIREQQKRIEALEDENFQLKAEKTSPDAHLGATEAGG